MGVVCDECECLGWSFVGHYRFRVTERWKGSSTEDGYTTFFFTQPFHPCVFDIAKSNVLCLSFLDSELAFFGQLKNNVIGSGLWKCMAEIFLINDFLLTFYFVFRFQTQNEVSLFAALQHRVNNKHQPPTVYVILKHYFQPQCWVKHLWRPYGGGEMGSNQFFCFSQLENLFWSHDIMSLSVHNSNFLARCSV